jgi:proteic killer suppression protein
MNIRSIRHRGLKRLIEQDDPRGVSPEWLRRIRHVIDALVNAPAMTAIQSLPGWRIHQFKGDRRRTWSIDLSGNWRITFTVEANEIHDLNLEDTH